MVGEAVDGHDALRLAALLEPDIVLLDIQLPDIDGFVVADQLGDGAHIPIVVLISSRDRSTYTSRLDAMPEMSFLSKRELSGAALDSLIS